VLSNFAYNLNLRSYSVDAETAAVEHDLAMREAALASEQSALAAALEKLRFQRPRESAAAHQVGRCRLTLSNPR
jgi:hypothetical protein